MRAQGTEPDLYLQPKHPVAITLAFKDRAFEAQLLTLSELGAKVATRALVFVGESLSVIARQPSELIVKATVVRTTREEDGLAVIVRFWEASGEKVRSFLADAAAEAAGLRPKESLRKFRRITTPPRVKLKARLRAGLQTFYLRVGDLSEEGCGLLGEGFPLRETLTAGQQVELMLFTRGYSLHCTAEIAHVSGGLAGLKFLNLSAEARVQLSRFLARIEKPHQRQG